MSETDLPVQVAVLEQTIRDMDRTLARLDARLDRLDARVDASIDKLDTRIDRLSSRLDRIRQSSSGSKVWRRKATTMASSSTDKLVDFEPPRARRRLMSLSSGRQRNLLLSGIMPRFRLRWRDRTQGPDGLLNRVHPRGTGLARRGGPARSGSPRRSGCRAAVVPVTPRIRQTGPRPVAGSWPAGSPVAALPTCHGPRHRWRRARQSAASPRWRWVLRSSWPSRRTPAGHGFSRTPGSRPRAAPGPYRRRSRRIAGCRDSRPAAPGRAGPRPGG